jgi:hypothetical protein
MIVQYLRATEFRRPKKRRGIVRSNDQKSMSINELRMLYEEVAIEFEEKLLSEEIDLEERLRHLQGEDSISGLDWSRRPTGLRRFDA